MIKIPLSLDELKELNFYAGAINEHLKKTLYQYPVKEQFHRKIDMDILKSISIRFFKKLLSEKPIKTFTFHSWEARILYSYSYVFITHNKFTETIVREKTSLLHKKLI
jgi:hypothetical protein